MTITKQDILKEKHLKDINVLLYTNLNVMLNRNADCITQHYTLSNIVSGIPIISNNYFSLQLHLKLKM